MLDVVTFKWGSKYRWEHVRRLQAMVHQHLPLRHRLTVLTDDPLAGARAMGDDVRMMAVDADLVPLGNAYPKLRVFDPHFPADRVLALDLDVTIVGNLLPIVARQESLVVLEEFTYNPGEGRKRGRYNTSVMLLDVGAATIAWSLFRAAPRQMAGCVKASHIIGSDQAWLSMTLPDDTATLGAADGIRSYRFDVQPNGRRPDDRIIVYHGRPKPWDVDAPPTLR